MPGERHTHASVRPIVSTGRRALGYDEGSALWRTAIIGGSFAGEMLMRKLGVFGLLGAIAVFQACGGGGGSNGIVTTPPPPPPPSPGTCAANTVCMQSASMDPSSLSVAKGTVVTFSNPSGIAHNIVFDTPRSTGVIDIGPFPAGAAAVTRTFNESGTWNLRCTIHAGMTGQIVVP